MYIYIYDIWYIYMIYISYIYMIFIYDMIHDMIIQSIDYLLMLDGVGFKALGHIQYV